MENKLLLSGIPSLQRDERYEKTKPTSEPRSARRMIDFPVGSLILESIFFLQGQLERLNRWVEEELFKISDDGKRALGGEPAW
jgi:hypothetical protein